MTPADGMRAALARRLQGNRRGAQPQVSDLLAAARAHRVHLLLAGALDRADSHDVDIWLALRDEYREAVAWDAAETAALRDLLTIAAADGVRPLLFKGAAVARVLYERSWERPRADVDLFIPERHAALMRRILERAGYVRAEAVDGPLVTGQFQYSRRPPGQPAFHADVHVRLFNPAAFARALDWDEADARAAAIPALGPHARTLSNADALLAACVHRVAHHRAASDLIWICDIDRLARRMGAGDWALFASVAAHARVRAVCADGLAEASALFDAPVPAPVSASLSSAGEEPSADFLRRRGGGELRVQLLNARHLPGWRSRASLLRQHLFPPAGYVLQKYDRRHPAWLPLLYAYRMINGAPRWLRGG